MVFNREVIAVQLLVVLLSSTYCSSKIIISDEDGHMLIVTHAPTPAPIPIKAPPPSPPVKAPPPSPPVKAPPSSPPVKAPPPSPPVKAPPPSPVKLSAAVEGVVYCMSCKLPGYVPAMNASPLSGANATVMCNNMHGSSTVNGNATTNAKGYFLAQVRNQRPSAISKCRVVMKLPRWCSTPVIPKFQNFGVRIRYERTVRIGTSTLVLFTTGLLEYAPARVTMCPRQLKD